jgi:hypothetical protein
MSINVREFSALRMSPSAGQRMMESMTEQLSLFQIPDGRMAEGLAAAGPMPGESDFGPVDELFRCNRRWRSRCSFLELLEFIARLPAYSPLNAFLIHVQDPAATRVATARMWARKYQRRLLPGARPIVILAPMSPVLFVFDVRDTEGPPMTPVVFPAAGPAGRPVRLLDTVLHNCAIQRLAVREDAGIGPSTERAIRLTPALRKKYAELGLESNTRYLVRLDSGLAAEAKCAALILELARIFCGHLGIDSDAWWPDRKDLDFNRIEIEAAAVAHLVCRRKGLAMISDHFLSECLKEDQELPPVSLNAIFQAAYHIESMGKRLWKKPRKQGRY